MEKLNDWMMLAANIGVLAGIVFLAYEIQVNTDAVRSESATNHLSDLQDIATLVITDDSNVSDVLEKATEEGVEGLSVEEFSRVAGVFHINFRVAESSLFHWREGNLDRDLWEGQNNRLYQGLWRGDRNWLRELWPTAKLVYGPVFRRYMNDMIADICARRECNDLGTLAGPESEMVQAMEAWNARFDDA